MKTGEQKQRYFALDRIRAIALLNMIAYHTIWDLSRLNTEDDYIAESEVFRVLDYDIEVKDKLISEALKYLPEKKRNVILLSFFLDMTDTEIAKHMNLVRNTIHHHRVSSLQALKKIMEGIRNGEIK